MKGERLAGSCEIGEQSGAILVNQTRSFEEKNRGFADNADKSLCNPRPSAQSAVLKSLKSAAFRRGRQFWLLSFRHVSIAYSMFVIVFLGEVCRGVPRLVGKNVLRSPEPIDFRGVWTNDRPPRKINGQEKIIRPARACCYYSKLLRSPSNRAEEK